ncbi:hypothetical protein OQA88_3202 [Cercophora sp. LCS_1]
MDSSSTPFLAAVSTMGEPDSGYKDSELDMYPTKRAQPNSQRCSLLIFHGVVYMFAIGGLATLLLQLVHFSLLSRDPPPSSPTPDVYRPSTLPTGLSICDCGSSVQEALSLGCIYDTLATAWLPPACRDDALTAQFDRAGPGEDGAWSYFADEAGAIPLTIADVAALGGTENNTFWASRTWHMTHCIFYWQKYWRMRRTGAVMEERFDSLAHVKHCGELLLNPHPPKTDKLLEVPVMMNSSMAAHVAAGMKTSEGQPHRHDNGDHEHSR